MSGQNNDTPTTGPVDVVTGEPLPEPNIDSAAVGSDVGAQGDGDGQSGATTDNDGTPEEEVFFDPASIEHSPELMSAYKLMQKAFSQKTQGVKDIQHKADAYDAFRRDPRGHMERFAKELGMQIVSADGKAGNVDTADDLSKWQPENWQQVMQKTGDFLLPQIMQQLKPLIESVSGLKKQSIETVLDSEFPDWRQYEDDMARLLDQHPSLVSDPAKLYQLAVPAEVLQSRAMKEALKKIESKVQGSDISTGHTRKTPQPEDSHKLRSFDEAVVHAKKLLASGGKK